MSVSDLESISVLLDAPAASQFDSYQWLNEADVNMGSYTNQLHLNTNLWRDNWMLYNKAYIQIPLSQSLVGGPAAMATEGYIQTTGTAGNEVYSGRGANRPNMCLKSGNYNLVNSFNFKINNTSIQNSNNLHLYTHINNMTQMSESYANSSATLYGVNEDTSNVNDAEPYTKSGGNVTGDNPKYNKGFRNRLINMDPIITQAPGSGAGGSGGLITITYNYDISIPLASISSFFQELNFPLKNVSIDMFIGLNGANFSGGEGANFTAQACDQAVMRASLNAAGNYVGPKLVIGGNFTQCRIWAPQVRLGASDELALSARLSTGITRSIVFTDVTVVKNVAAPTQAILDMTVSPAIRRATRLWSVFYPLSLGNGSGLSGVGAPAAGGSLLAYPATTYPSTSAPGIYSEQDTTSGRVGLTNANMKVNSEKLFQDAIVRPSEWYMLLRDQFYNSADDKQTGSLISYDEFRKLHQYYVFDLLRNNKVLTDTPVAIQFQATKVNPSTATELYHIIETEAVVTMTLQTGDITVTNVGQH